MGKLFSPSAPKMPKPPKPTPMADEEAIERAKRRAAQATRQRGGRESTLLSDTDRLGG
jgi:hypothetical protein